MKKIFSSKVGVILTASLCCLLWGSAFPMIKIGYKLIGISSDDTASQIFFAGIRFTLAGIFTLIFGSIISKKAVLPEKSGIKKAAILSLFQTILQYVFFYIGLAHSTGSKSSIINASSVFFAVIISAVIIKSEKLTVKKTIGLAIGFLGVILVNLAPSKSDASFSLAGEGAILASSVSYAVSTVLIKLFSKSENPVALSGCQFTFGGIIMTIAAYIAGGKIEIEGLSAVWVILYLAALSACAYTLWGILLKYNDVSKVAVFGFMTPLFGYILSQLILKEKQTQSAIITSAALILVCAGIFLVNSKSKNNTCGG